MVVDSSAVVAIILQEPGYEALLERLLSAELAGIGAPTVVEAAIVLSARVGTDMRPQLTAFLAACGIQVIPFTELHVQAAAQAFLRFRKGRHPAALNFGDCLTYAAAEIAGTALLFTGGDFTQTDIVRA